MLFPAGYLTPLIYFNNLYWCCILTICRSMQAPLFETKNRLPAIAQQFRRHIGRQSQQWPNRLWGPCHTNDMHSSDQTDGTAMDKAPYFLQ